MDSSAKAGKNPKQILASLKASRKRKGGNGPGKSAVYDFLAGKTHKRGAVETRGRKAKLPRGMVQVAFTQRRKLIRAAPSWASESLAESLPIRRANSVVDACCTCTPFLTQ